MCFSYRVIQLLQTLLEVCIQISFCLTTIRCAVQLTSNWSVLYMQRDLKREKAVQVWDLDTTLPCPATFADYVAGAFQPWVSLKPEFSRLPTLLVRIECKQDCWCSLCARHISGFLG
jgi:hypothetical protein